MLFVSRWFRRIEERYRGPEGVAYALEELAPVAARFLGEGRVLEVGCGDGRNLVALAATPARIVVGCDVSRAELERAARERLGPLPPERRARVGLARQEPDRLPFGDGAFDLVVLWQVLEHVFGRDAKQKVFDECARVLRSGGHLLVQTPNQWFPVDYHDNHVPLAHWLLPRSGRMWLTAVIRGERYEPSQYLSLRGCERMLRRAPQVARLQRATRLYFASGWSDAFRRLGGTQVRLKRLLLLVLAPVHAALSLFGGTADPLLPSIRVVWRIEKRGAVVRP